VAPAPRRARRHRTGERAVPALPGGEGLVAVVNSDAGGDVPAEVELRALLPKAELRICESGDDLHTALQHAVADIHARGGALGVVGGDGTVNAAAVLAADSHLPLAVFPAGILDHFATDLGLPALKDTADAVEEGTGTLARSRVYREATATRLRIDGVGKEGDYTQDGEVSPASGTLILDKAPRALTAYLPTPQ
jgi:hypothetical protein